MIATEMVMLSPEVWSMKDKRVIPDFSPDGLLGLKEMKISSDVLGSYTGLVRDLDDKPVQDADDL